MNVSTEVSDEMYRVLQHIATQQHYTVERVLRILVEDSIKVQGYVYPEIMYRLVDIDGDDTNYMLTELGIVVVLINGLYKLVIDNNDENTVGWLTMRGIDYEVYEKYFHLVYIEVHNIQPEDMYAQEMRREQSIRY